MKGSWNRYKWRKGCLSHGWVFDSLRVEKGLKAGVFPSNFYLAFLLIRQWTERSESSNCVRCQSSSRENNVLINTASLIVGFQSSGCRSGPEGAFNPSVCFLLAKKGLHCAVFREGLAIRLSLLLYPTCHLRVIKNVHTQPHTLIHSQTYTHRGTAVALHQQNTPVGCF